MAGELVPRVFAAHEASEAAHLVVNHDPETSRTVALLPADEAAADASVVHGGDAWDDAAYLHD